MHRLLLLQLKSPEKTKQLGRTCLVPDRRQLGHDPVGKRHHAQPSQVFQGHVAQRGGDLSGQAELRRAAQPHAGRAVQQDVDVEILGWLEGPGEQLIVSGAAGPIDVTIVVARHVIPQPGRFGAASSAAGQLLSRRGHQRSPAQP